MAGQLLATLIIAVACITSARAQTDTSVMVPTQPAWNRLNAQQRTALAPLSKEWNSFTDARKLKWLGIAARYSNMSATEQVRVQDRMREWIALTPVQREIARIQYKKLQAVSPEARKDLSQKWQEYEALPAEEKEKIKAAAPAILLPSQSGPVAVPYANAKSQPPKPLLTVTPTLRVKPRIGAPLATASEPK